MRPFFIYLVTLATFAVTDALWLAVMGPTFYTTEIGPLMRPSPNLPVAALFYLVYPIGLVALATLPALAEGALAGALWRAAVFGLCAYATYDLTNLATLKGWSPLLSVVDLAWGVVASMLAATSGYFFGRWLQS